MNSAASHQRGFTLIELMISITIGLILSAAIASLFIQNKQSTRQSNNLAAMQANARFAMQILSEELIHADFYGESIDPEGIDTTDTALTITTDCTGPWAYVLDEDNARFDYMFQKTATEVNNDYDCIATTDFRDSTDANFNADTNLLAIKRVKAFPYVDPNGAPDAGDNKVYLRSNGTLSELYLNTGSANQPNIRKSDNVTPADDWEYQANIYYINKNGTLYREYLSAGSPPSMVSEPLVDGIDYFHIEFGIDDTVEINLDGFPSFYTGDPGINIQYATSARLYVLARSPDPDPQYTNEKSYEMGSVTIDLANDNYYRRVYTTTVPLKNILSRIHLE